MLGSCENMIEEKALNPSSDQIMEKPSPIDQSPKCPRCDSSNTKFCYYNNYSLSQPRHFCKACKRYWTRGGTLRNVPVGGGCRKNKRVRRPSASDAQSTPPPYFPSQLDVPNTANETSPFFYGLPPTNSNMNLAYSTLRSSFVDSNSENLGISCAPYDLQPQTNALRLSFPSSITASKDHGDEEFPVGFSPSTASLLPDYPLFGSGSSSSNTTSLNASSLQQQQQQNHFLGLKDNQPTNDLQVFFPYQDFQIMGNANSRILKGVKTEEFSNDRSNKMDWHVPRENPIDSIGSDSSLFWNTAIGTWSDSTNFMPYVSPLI